MISKIVIEMSIPVHCVHETYLILQILEHMVIEFCFFDQIITHTHYININVWVGVNVYGALHHYVARC